MSPLAILPQARRRRRLQERVAAVPDWWHAIDLGDGVVSPGHKGGGHAHMRAELESLRLPELAGKTVLDIGAWDGFYSFEAERLGARRVVALDHYVWGRDQTRRSAPLDLVGLPGKAGFDLAHDVLGSDVEARVEDFMEADLDALGGFEVVLFLGVIYHLEDPLRAMRRLASVTTEVAVIESEAAEFAGVDAALCQFFAGSELNDDPTNWWVPNLRALSDLCLAAGFARVDVIRGPPAPGAREPTRYRAIVHAWR